MKGFIRLIMLNRSINKKNEPQAFATCFKAAERMSSIDQYRGYAIFGMILVNYLGGFDSMPWILKHHDNGMSYADTIAPLFVFVSGMTFLLSFRKKQSSQGYYGAVISSMKRLLVLIIIGIVLYGPAPDNWRYWWDALVDIGFAGLLSLPFLRMAVRYRVKAAALFLAFYQVLYVFGYGAWTMSNSIDGGPLGVLSWTAIFLFGTVAYDIIQSNKHGQVMAKCLIWGTVLCCAGWILKIEWPGIKAEWPFSQRSMCIPYPLFSTGLCFLTYIPFRYICDLCRLEIPHLRTLGVNPLVIYLVQQVLGDMHGSGVVSSDSGPLLALAGFIFFYGICYMVARKLLRDKVIIKI